MRESAPQLTLDGGEDLLEVGPPLAVAAPAPDDGRLFTALEAPAGSLNIPELE